MLENGEFRPVGGAHVRHTKARVLAATNESLEEAAVAAGRLRADLYYRIARFHIRIPPLRGSGPDDILLLARHFLRAMYDEFEVVLADDLTAALRAPQLARQRPRAEKRNRAHRPARRRRPRAAGRSIPLRRPPRPPPRTPPPPSPRMPPATSAAAEPLDSEGLPAHGTLGRRDRLRALFDRYRRLTRAQIIELIGCSPNTATSDLHALLESEGWIRRIHTSGPTSAPAISSARRPRRKPEKRTLPQMKNQMDTDKKQKPGIWPSVFDLCHNP